MKTKYLIVALSILFVASLSGSQLISAAKKDPANQVNTGNQCGAANHSKQKPAAPPARSTSSKGGANANANTSTGNITSTVSKDGTSVVISGGFDTDPQDHGRPDVLIAAALGVPTEVFREAFSGVTPAGAGSGGPTSAEAQSNKAALLKVLAPYGITNDFLDEVSNYYRYNASKGEVWQRTPAEATAILTNGVVTGVTITNPGSGYSSAPTVTITGPDGKAVTATATIAYTKDFSTNGSFSSLTIQ